MSLRGAIGMAAALMSGVMLGVEAKGAEMLVMPGMDIGGASLRVLSENNSTSTTEEMSTTEAAKTTAEDETTSAEDTKTAEADTTSAAGETTAEDSETTASDKNEDKARAVVAGTMSMGVEDKDAFCGNTAALEAIGNVLKAKTGSADSSVSCPARRLEDGAVRRLVEEVELTYELIFYADSADGTIDENSAAVVAAMSAITDMDATDLQTLIAAEFAAQGIEGDVVVNSISAPTVTIQLPTTTTLSSSGNPTETDASSRPSVWVCSLFAAGVSSLAFLK